MFADEHRSNLWDQLRQRDLCQFRHLLTPDRLTQAAANAGMKRGRGALNLFTLTWLAIGGAWHAGHNFAGVLAMVLKLLGDVGQLPQPRRDGKRSKRQKRSKHDPRGTGDQLSEEAFTQARSKMPDSFWVALFLLLGSAFQEQHAALTFGLSPWTAPASTCPDGNN
jgi:hypothetical protein